MNIKGFYDYLTTSSFFSFVNNRPHCPFILLANLCTFSACSLSLVLPKAKAINLLLPKKNLLFFQCDLTSLRATFLIFRTKKRNNLSYLSKASLTPDTRFCLKSSPFFFVCVNETNTEKN